MEFANVVRNASLLALMCMVIPLATLGMAIAYAYRPDERRLALMRPLSLAAIFAALCGFAAGAVSILRGIAVTQTLSPESWRHIALGTAEAFVPLFIAFGCLTLAWLTIAIGMRRTAT